MAHLSFMSLKKEKGCLKMAINTASFVYVSCNLLIPKTIETELLPLRSNPNIGVILAQIRNAGTAGGEAGALLFAAVLVRPADRGYESIGLAAGTSGDYPPDSAPEVGPIVQANLERGGLSALGILPASAIRIAGEVGAEVPSRAGTCV